MEETGIAIDFKKIQEIELALKKQINEMETEVGKAVGMSTQKTLFGDSKLTIDLDSPHQLGDLLYRKLGLPVLDSTPGGRPKTGSDVLEKLKDMHPVIETIIKYKACRKLLTAFISPLPSRADRDGRVRTSYKDCGTKTGRLSSQNPNMQQLPRNDKEYKIRKCFISSKGKTLLVFDFSQEELRVAAHLTNDPTMLEVYKNNKDLHLTTANKIYKLSLNEAQLTVGTKEYKESKKKYSKERQYSKYVSFGLLYGIGTFGLSRQIGCSDKEAKQIIDDYFKEFPRVKREIELTKRDFIKYGYVKNLFGRYRHSKKEQGQYPTRAFRQNFNFRVQGTCADILRVVMIELYKFLEDKPEAKMLLTVHDEVVFEVPDDKIEYYSKEFKRIMESAVQLKLPLEVEGSSGKNYAEAK